MSFSRTPINAKRITIRSQAARHGISLVEVMVSMIVALIGVFGVFVLIPFAVRQVEIAMNVEAAQTLARNGMSSFDTAGFQDTSRWAYPETDMLTAPFYQPVPTLPAYTPPGPPTRQVFCIDPWGWTLHGLVPGNDPGDAALVRPAFARVPYVSGAWAWPIFFPRLSLFDRGIPGTPDVFTRGMARRMFSGHDDLITQAPTDDFSGPTQSFFQPFGGRQFAGRLTWRMFVVQDNRSEGYARFYAAVSLARNPDTTDRVFGYTAEPAASPPPPGPLTGGGDVILFERTLPPNPNTIRRGQWLMLVEGTPLPLATPPFEVKDIAFYRVLEADFDGTNHIITLQGNDYHAEAGSEVYFVLLPDVISVYERTMKYESSSNWNLN